MLGIPGGVGTAAARAAAADFGHESGLGLEGVEVEMEGKGLLRLSGEIFIGESFARGDGVLGGIELGLDLVGDDSGGKCFFCVPLNRRRLSALARGLAKKWGRKMSARGCGECQHFRQLHPSSHT